MKKDGRSKRAKHARKIAQCEKKFPVYGFGDINNKVTIERLQKMGIFVNQINDKGENKAVNSGVDLLPLFDDVDHNFDKDKLTPEIAEALRKFIIKKTES